MIGLNTILCTKGLHFTKQLLLFVVFLTVLSCIEDKSKRPSPLAIDSLRVDGKLISIEYSSPAVRNREIWGVLDPYDKVWRIGANEATIFYTEHTLIFADSLILPGGKYSLFAIPRKGDWTIIFNKEWDQWGSYNYNEAEDQLRFDITPVFVSELQERLNFDISEESLNFHWEYLQFKIPYVIR